MSEENAGIFRRLIARVIELLGVATDSVQAPGEHHVAQWLLKDASEGGVPGTESSAKHHHTFTEYAAAEASGSGMAGSEGFPSGKKHPRISQAPLKGHDLF